MEMKVVHPEFEQPVIKPRGRVTLSPLMKVLSFAGFCVGIIVLILLFRISPAVIPTPPSHIVRLEEFTEALNGAENEVIYDMRTLPDYSAAHVPNALHGVSDTCHMYGMDICTRNRCKSPRPHFFYSVKGEEYHEVIDAIRETKGKGCISEVWLLDGGFEDWQEEGLPMSN